MHHATRLLISSFTIVSGPQRAKRASSSLVHDQSLMAVGRMLRFRTSVYMKWSFIDAKSRHITQLQERMSEVGHW
jgi:hypothetical protein